MKNLIRTILFMFFIVPVFSQSYASNPVKAIIDNPDSPELPSLILKTTDYQAKSRAKIDLNSLKVRNTFMVQFVEGQGLLVQMQPSASNQLQELFLLFLNNPTGSPEMSDSINASTPLTGEFFVSEGSAIVQYSLEDVQAVVPAVRELARALAKYRDLISVKSFKTPYALVPDLGKSVIDQFLSSKLILLPSTGAPSLTRSSADVPPIEGEPASPSPNEPVGSPHKQEPAASTVNQGYPDFPSMDDLGQAAEKLKDVFLGGGEEKQGVNKSSGSNNKSADSKIYTIDVVDYSPVTEPCKSSIGTLESRECFVETIEKLVQHNFNKNADLGQGEKGKIFVQFIVNTDGKLIEREVLRGLTLELGLEAIRALDNIKLLAPAKIDGTAVKLRHVVTIEVGS